MMPLMSYHSSNDHSLCSGAPAVMRMIYFRFAAISRIVLAAILAFGAGGAQDMLRLPAIFHAGISDYDSHSYRDAAAAGFIIESFFASRQAGAAHCPRRRRRGYRFFQDRLCVDRWADVDFEVRFGTCSAPRPPPFRRRDLLAGFSQKVSMLANDAPYRVSPRFACRRAFSPARRIAGRSEAPSSSPTQAPAAFLFGQRRPGLFSHNRMPRPRPAYDGPPIDGQDDDD